MAKMSKRNFVAKNMNKFNKGGAHRDRTKYKRQPKHKNREI